VTQAPRAILWGDFAPHKGVSVSENTVAMPLWDLTRGRAFGKPLGLVCVVCSQAGVTAPC